MNKQKNDDTPGNDVEHFHELLESFRTVMLVTHALPEDGLNATRSTFDDVEVTSRPMQVARLEDNCDLWFLTDEETAKVYEIKREPVVHVVAQDDNDRFVSMRGIARVVRDRNVIRELWSEPYKVWFPEGPDTPGICAIQVEGHEGQYWDNEGIDKVRYMLQAAKAYVTGKRVQPDEDENGRVDLR